MLDVPPILLRLAHQESTRSSTHGAYVRRAAILSVVRDRPGRGTCARLLGIYAVQIVEAQIVERERYAAPRVEGSR